MTGRIVRWMCLALAMGSWAGPVSAASDGKPIYAITRVGSAITDDDLVGSKRAGMVCLPSGPIRWRDVGTGGSLDQREVVQDALEDAGLAITPLGSFGGGTAGHPALSGDAALEIEWRLEALDGSEVSHVSKVSRHVDEHHAASLTGIYRQLLADSAVDVAAWLRAAPH